MADPLQAVGVPVKVTTPLPAGPPDGDLGIDSAVPGNGVQYGFGAVWNLMIAGVAFVAHDLDTIAGTGIAVRTGVATWVTRTLVAGTGITISDPDGVAAAPTITLANTTVVAGAYGSASGVSVITVDAQGRLTAAATTAIAISAAAVTSGILVAARGGTGLDGSSAANGTLPIGNGAGFTLANITGSATISVTNGPGTIALDTIGIAPVDATYVTLTLNGSLTNERVLTGTANQVVITDGGAGTTVTLSLPQNIHTAASPTFAALTLTAPLTVPNGGTGVTTLAAGGVLYGNGAGVALVTAAPASGNLLVGSAGAIPVFVAMSGDATIVAAGTLTIAARAVSYAKIQTMTTSRILGRTTAVAGDIEELTAGTSLLLTGGSLNAIQDIRTTATPLFLTVRVSDTDVSNFMEVSCGSNLTANRSLSFVPGDAARTITLSGNPTLADWFDQAVKVASSPTFAALTLTAPLTLANGGTAAALTASLGGIVYSTATAFAVLSGTATANQVLLSGAAATPAWSTATYPATAAISTILYASSANVISALATANSGVLVTSAGGVPSIGTDIPTAVTIGAKYVYRADGTDVPPADGGLGISTVPTNGQIPIGSTAAAKYVAATISVTAPMTVTNGAGSITLAAPGAFIKTVTILTGTTTYTPSANTHTIVAMGVGGGGGGGAAGGGANAAAGGGGSSGGYWEHTVAVTPSVALAVAVGAGGVAGTGAANGSVGGITTLNDGSVVVTANGGLGGGGMAAGTSVSYSGGAAGPAVSTNASIINGGGAPGHWSMRQSGTVAVSGAGGSSRFGPGGRGITNSGVGITPVGYGGGGGGGLSQSGSAAVDGGTGAPGVIVVHEYA